MWMITAFVQVEREGRAAARLKELAEAAAREVDQGMSFDFNIFTNQEFHSFVIPLGCAVMWGLSGL